MNKTMFRPSNWARSTTIRARSIGLTVGHLTIFFFFFYYSPKFHLSSIKNEQFTTICSATAMVM